MSEGAEILVLEVPRRRRETPARAAERAAAPARRNGGRRRRAAAPRPRRRAPTPRPRALPRPGEPAARRRARARRAAPAATPRRFAPPTSASSVVLVERFPVLGGVCLHVGCIPSKTLLHVAEVIREAARARRRRRRVRRAEARPRPPARAQGRASCAKLADGLAGLAQARAQSQVLTGSGRFESPNARARRGRRDEHGRSTSSTRSSPWARAPSRCPACPTTRASSTRPSALALADVPARLLVVGGGVIGLELATVYEALGSRVSVVELLPELLAGVDADLVRPLRRRIEARYEAIWCGTRLLERRAPRPAGCARASRGREPPPRRASTACSSRSAGPAAAARSRAERAGAARRRARLHRGRRAAAHQRAARLRDRRRHRAAAARAPRDAPGQGRGRGDRRARRRPSIRGGAVGGLHRSRGRLGGAHRERGEAERGVEVEKARLPVVGERARARHRPRRGPDQAALLEAETGRLARRGHRRRARGRADRRGGAWRSSSARRRGSRARDPPPPDALRDASASPPSSPRARSPTCCRARRTPMSARAPPAPSCAPRALARRPRVARRRALRRCGDRARADLRAPGETPVADVLQLIVLEREIVAVDGLAGAELRQRPRARRARALRRGARAASAWCSPTGASSPWRCARAPGRRRATGAASRRPRAPSSASRSRSS